MKANLYVGAIIAACEKELAEIKAGRAAADYRKMESFRFHRRFWFFGPKLRRSDEECRRLAGAPSRLYWNQEQRIFTLRALAKHHKAGMMLTVEDDYLSDIAIFLAPSEAYDSERI